MIARRERRGGLVVDACNHTQEVGEVVALGEAGELVAVVQSHVDDLADGGVLQGVEEGPGGSLGEADGEESGGRHVVFSIAWLIDI